MAKKQSNVTPPMIVRYAYLTVPSTTHKSNGQYTVKCAILADSPEAAELKEFLKARYEEVIPPVLAQLNPAQKKKIVKVPPWQIEEDKDTGEETGYLTMTFSMDAKVVRKKDSKVFEFAPELFDAENHAIPLTARTGLKIGGGTVVRVAYTADRGYCMEATDASNKKFTKSGLSIDLQAVKIIDLVEYGASAGSYGFGEDEGGTFSREAIQEAEGNETFGDDSDLEGNQAMPPGDGDF